MGDAIYLEKTCPEIIPIGNSFGTQKKKKPPACIPGSYQQLREIDVFSASGSFRETICRWTKHFPLTCYRPKKIGIFIFFDAQMGNIFMI